MKVRGMQLRYKAVWFSVTDTHTPHASQHTDATPTLLVSKHVIILQGHQNCLLLQQRNSEHKP